MVIPNLPGAQERYEVFFNKRFELYGRKLVLKPIVTGGTCELVGRDRRIA